MKSLKEVLEIRGSFSSSAIWTNGCVGTGLPSNKEVSLAELCGELPGELNYIIYIIRYEA